MCLSPCFSEFGNHLFHTFVTQLTSNDDRAMVVHFPSQFVIYRFESAELKGKYVKQRPKQIPNLKTTSVDRNNTNTVVGQKAEEARVGRHGPQKKVDLQRKTHQMQTSLLRSRNCHFYGTQTNTNTQPRPCRSSEVARFLRDGDAGPTHTFPAPGPLCCVNNGGR